MKPIVLCILDGVGLRKEKHGNAFSLAHTPNLDRLFEKYPHGKLMASGSEVGLPDGQMGNSEVGHMNIGAGRIVYQPLAFINSKIKNHSFEQNEVILNLLQKTKEKHKKLHLCGLLSDGGVHSDINHLFALLDLCKKNNMENLYLHLFLDGRDVYPDSALIYIKKLEEKLTQLGIGKIATISGRYYAMDRDNRWDRIQKTYEVMTEGTHKIENIEKYIKDSYEKKIYDEFIEPVTLDEDGIVESEDGILVFNFRPDRLRELFQTFTNPNFKNFKVKPLSLVSVVTMMPVSEEVNSIPAFHLENLENTLGDVLSKNHYTQLRLAETEKYAHVTYFLDGGVEKNLEGCDRILIPSPKVSTYDLKPEMSAFEITDTLIKKIGQYDVMIVNFANGDMVGHTGNLDATISAMEVLDCCIGKIYEKIIQMNGLMLITADHGNAEYMLDMHNHLITSHTTNKVPFIVCDSAYEVMDGKLSDIAPTILRLLSLEIPKEMNGNTLINEKKV